MCVSIGILETPLCKDELKVIFIVLYFIIIYGQVYVLSFFLSFFYCIVLCGGFSLRFSQPYISSSFFLFFFYFFLVWSIGEDSEFQRCRFAPL